MSVRRSYHLPLSVRVPPVSIESSKIQKIHLSCLPVSPRGEKRRRSSECCHSIISQLQQRPQYTLLYCMFITFFCTTAILILLPGNSCTMANQTSVSDLVTKDPKDIVELLGGIYEHSPWVAETLVQDLDALKSLKTVTELASSMKKIVDVASREQKMALLCAHPDLCEKVTKLKELTKESQEEQSKAGLQSMEGEELEKFTLMNTKYRDTFKFPFILAVRNATKYTVLSALEGRVVNPPEKEFSTALEQVHKIAWMRLLTAYYSSEYPGFLTCHVLDTANGCPAARMRIQLTRLSPPESAGVVGDFITNEDGRLEGGPALKGKDFMVGSYEWTFYAGNYFASKGTFTSGQPFLDVIPIRFGIDNPDDHYHVPLLVSPWSFSTYRGS